MVRLVDGQLTTRPVADIQISRTEIPAYKRSKVKITGLPGSSRGNTRLTAIVATIKADLRFKPDASFRVDWWNNPDASANVPSELSCLGIGWALQFLG